MFEEVVKNEPYIKSFVKGKISNSSKKQADLEEIFYKLIKVLRANFIGVLCYIIPSYAKFQYKKYPIYKHKDSNLPFSIFILLITIVQKALINAHQVDHNITVLSQTPIVQNNYKVSYINKGNIINDELSTKFRRKGIIDFDNAKFGFVYRLINLNNSEAGSVAMHIYNNVKQINICTICKDRSTYYSIPLAIL